MTQIFLSFYKSYYPIPRRPVNFPVIKYGSYRIHSGIIKSSLDVEEDTKFPLHPMLALFYQPIGVKHFLLISLLDRHVVWDGLEVLPLVHLKGIDLPISPVLSVGRTLDLLVGTI